MSTDIDDGAVPELVDAPPPSTAAMAGRRPAQPTIAPIVQSAPEAAASTTASAPAATRVPVPASACLRSP